MRRRTLLTAIGAGTLSLAGCIADPDAMDPDGGPATSTRPTGTDDGTDGPPDTLEDCQTSQGLDVEWPEELDAATVESFVEEYEHVYYRDVAVGYEPESSLDSYELSGSVSGSPRAVGDGWELEYSGGGGVYRPTLLFDATTSDSPDGADVIPVSEIDDEALTEMLHDAAETGEAEFQVDTPGEEVEQCVDLLATVSEESERLSGPGDSETLYVAVDDSTVELSVQATNVHGDYWWNAWYYVDERVVRRTTDEDTDPRNGELLECRTLD